MFIIVFIFNYSGKKMSKKLEALFDITSKDFLETMEQLVSNDKTIREKSFPKLKEYLKQSYDNNIELYQKISRSLFYFFYNTDKPNYQLSMAKLISSLIYLNDNDKILIPNHELWINTFLSEFGNKFKSLDVLRLDKYIMLCDQVLSTYLTACLENKKFNSIISLIKYFSQDINNSTYSFSFESNKLNIIKRFINVLFDKNIEMKNKQEFINNKENGFISFFKSLLEFYSEIKDKREIEFFNKNILDNLLNIIYNNKKEYLDLFNNIKKESEIFFENNKNILIKPKIEAMDYFINKLKDENYKKEEKIKYDINDFIVSKKYKQNFRKSKKEIIKEIKEKKEHNKNKKREEIKQIKDNYKDIDISDIQVEKEIINLDNENDKANKDLNFEGKKILNKKIKRDKK